MGRKGAAARAATKSPTVKPPAVVDEPRSELVAALPPWLQSAIDSANDDPTEIMREMGGRQGILKVDSLVPNPWNPQTMSAETFAMLVEEIRDNHCIAPVTVVDMEDGTYRIIGGEHRWRACQELGKKYIPAFIMALEDWDEERQEFETVRLNMLHGEIDPRKFLPLYEKAVEKYGQDAIRNLFRFSDAKKFKEIVARMSEGVRSALSTEAAEEFDRKAQRATTVADLTKIVQDLYAKGSGTLDQGYMVLTYGGQDHVYVQLDMAGKRALNRVQDWLRLKGGQTISEFMAPVLDACLDKVNQEMESDPDKANKLPPDGDPETLPDW